MSYKSMTFKDETIVEVIDQARRGAGRGLTLVDEPRPVYGNGLSMKRHTANRSGGASLPS